MADLGPEIGATLRETRMRARIDIGEVEIRTKIRAKYLRAIENEEWDLLPGPIYVKSFLRTYGEYLGLDARQLVDEYKRRYETPADSQHRPLSSVKRERERERERAVRGRGAPSVPSWLLVAVVLVVVAGALYLVGVSGNNTTTRTTPPRTVPTHAATTPVTDTTRTATTPPAPAQASLQFQATAPDYVCVEDAAQKQLVPGVTFSAGQSQPLVHSTELLVNIGNANMDLTVNGKPYPLSASSTSIGLKITPTSVTPLDTKPTCGA
jgi:cytoskeletal protein RodZ